MSEKTNRPAVSVTPPGIDYVISNRSHEFVYKSLRLSEENFFPQSRVLSIGEGLSDFSSKLHEKGIDVVAIDPLYAIGKNLFGKSIDETCEIVSRWYQGKVVFRDYRHEETISGIPKEPLVAGSVYSLPFPDKSFTHLFGHRIFEHLDLSRALPEMIRVLKDDGEIRLGGVQLSAFPKDEKLMTGTLQYNPDTSTFYYIPAKKIQETFFDLSTTQNLPNVYVVLDCLPRMAEVQNQGALVAGLMIIRKDDTVPTYTPISDGTSPFLGKMYKVDIANFASSPDDNNGHYKLIPVNQLQ